MGIIRDKFTNILDKAGLANPVEVINESLGGETRAESRARRARQAAEEAARKAAEEAAQEAAAQYQPIVVRTPPKPSTTNKRKGGMINGRKSGYVKAADGCAIKGKTRGKII